MRGEKSLMRAMKTNRRVEENLQRLSSHHIDHLRKLNDLRSLLERTQQTLEDKGEYLETTRIGC